MRPLVPLVALIVLLGTRPSAQVDLDTLLERATQYVVRFEQDLSRVLSDETYRQDMRILGAGSSQPGANLMGVTSGDTTIRGEMLFLWVPQDRRWLAVRRVESVRQGNNLPRPISDSAMRLDRLLAAADTDISVLRRIADENGRFNIGGVFRNYNTPTIALQLLDPAYRSNFAFALAGEERVRGVLTIKVTFTEPKRPTLIALNGGDLPASGALWLRASDGLVVQTLLTVRVAGLQSSIQVQYARDAKVELWVPTRMEEWHNVRVGEGDQVIKATADYRNYRRFETGARLIG